MSKTRKEEKRQQQMQKQKNKQEAKEARRRAREKPYRVHVEVRNRLIQIIIWMVIFFFIALGAVSFATREDSTSVKRTLSKAIAAMNQSSSAEEQAGSLALAFMYDYLTYNPEMPDIYLQKINAYAANGLTFELPTHNAVTTVKSAAIKGTNADGSGNINVTIQVKVEASGIQRTEAKVNNQDGNEATGSEQAYTTEQLLDYCIPVNVQNGNCAVIAEPLLVADQNTAKRISAPEGLSEEGSLEESVQRNVKVLAGNFLKAYYGKDRNELLYFVTRNFGSTATVGANLRFREITEIHVMPYKRGYEAEVTYTISDNLIEQKQKVYLVILPGTEGRMYVDQMNTRKIP